MSEITMTANEDFLIKLTRKHEERLQGNFISMLSSVPFAASVGANKISPDLVHKLLPFITTPEHINFATFMCIAGTVGFFDDARIKYFDDFSLAVQNTFTKEERKKLKPRSSRALLTTFRNCILAAGIMASGDYVAELITELAEDFSEYVEEITPEPTN